MYWPNSGEFDFVLGKNEVPVTKSQQPVFPPRSRTRFNLGQQLTENKRDGAVRLSQSSFNIQTS